jgi:dienelactone hydrolase
MRSRFACFCPVLLLLSLAAAPLARARQDASKGEMVPFPSGELTLRGMIYRPAGAGPFPALLWNHGSGKTPGEKPDLSRFYTDHGFVFFLPYRRGHGGSPGDYIIDLEARFRRTTRDADRVHRYSVMLHERYNQDVVDAIVWLKKQPFVDPNRIAVSGVSYGGIQTLLTAEKDLGIKAAIPFAPTPKRPDNDPLRQRMLVAVRNSRVPIFLIQAQNDYSLWPSELLGPEIRRRGEPNRAKLYPAYGNTQEEGHADFSTHASAIAVWGDDVLAFLRAAGVT